MSWQQQVEDQPEYEPVIPECQACGDIGVEYISCGGEPKSCSCSVGIDNNVIVSMASDDDFNFDDLNFDDDDDDLLDDDDDDDDDDVCIENDCECGEEPEVHVEEDDVIAFDPNLQNRRDQDDHLILDNF